MTAPAAEPQTVPSKAGLDDHCPDIVAADRSQRLDAVAEAAAPGVLHQGLEGLAADAHQAGVIAALKINLMHLGETFVEQNVQPVGCADRRDGAQDTVVEYLRDLAFSGQAQRHLH